MHRTTVISFLATIGVAVPAAWHVLGADIRTDGKKLRTFQQSFTFDNTRVTLDVDRNVVQTGDKVTATLRAYGPPRQVAIDLAVVQTNNYQGERVEQPSTQIDHEKLLLTVLPDGGPAKATTVRLGSRPSQLALTDSFRIFITQHGHKPEMAVGEFGGESEPDWNGAVESGNAAAVGIMGWSGNSLTMKIVPEGPVTTKAPFIVAVHVANTSGREQSHHPMVGLGVQITSGGYVDNPAEEVDIERLGADGEPESYMTTEEQDATFAVGADLVTRFRVTPKLEQKQFTFVADADIHDSQPGPTVAGGMEIATIPISESAEVTAAK
jgi:hypothetical protein